jgi:cell division protein FtsQ
MEVYEQFLRELDGSGQHLTDSVSEVDVADPEDVKALITSGSSDILVHFGQQDFLKRYQEFEEHLAEWKQQYPKLASADMRYDGQIVLQMQGDGGSAAAGPSAAQIAKAEGASLVAARPVAKPIASAKAPALKPAVVRSAVARPAAKPATKVSGSAALKPASSKAAGAKSTVLHPAVSKPAPVKPSGWKPAGTNLLASHAATPKAAAPKPVALNGAASKPVSTPKFTPAKSGRPAAKAGRPVAKTVGAKARPGSGMSAANEKVFARLAAEHRAELAREHKATTVSKNGRKAVKGGVAR